MFDTLVRPRPVPDQDLTTALAAAAAAIARLDEALANHPLRLAFLYRARLDAARRQAAVDGQLIDPWHLAAMLEGLRVRAEARRDRLDRGSVIDAARHAFDQYQWLVFPDFDQEGAVRQAAAHLAGFASPGETPLLTAARGLHAWLGTGSVGDGDPRGTRPPIRAALVRFWTGEKLLRMAVPLTGAAALRAESPFDWARWAPAFLEAVAAEAADGRQLLMDLERAWFGARAAVAGRRRDSHAAAAVDRLAAVPLISATSLAAALGIAVKNSIRLLDDFVGGGIAVEVTHRSRRRLFGLKAMAPLADAVRLPYRPEPGRRRGRPPGRDLTDAIADPPELPPAPLPSLTPVERRAFDYSDVEHDMAQLDRVVSQTKRALDTLVRPTIESAVPTRQSADAPRLTAEPGAQIDRIAPNV